MDIFILLFSCFLIMLALGINRSWRQKHTQKHSYSLIVPCRNEEDNLPVLFEALEKIDYPTARYEIIIVDDASNDDSLQLIKAFCEKKENAHYIQINEKNKELKGKKAAIQKAADKAKKNYLLLLDADCFPRPGILLSYDAHIRENIGLIAGNYRELNADAFSRFINLMTSAINAATIGLGIPFSASGGNLLIRKATFFEFNGYYKVGNHIAGDDKLLINLVNRTNWKIAYNADHIVDTTGETGKKNLHEQQKRKFGKLEMSSHFYKLLAGLILLFFIYLPARLISNFIWQEFLIYYCSALIFWLINLAKHKEKLSISAFFFILYYPYYLIFYSLIGNFGKWQWKGQNSN